MASGDDRSENNLQAGDDAESQHDDGIELQELRVDELGIDEQDHEDMVQQSQQSNSSNRPKRVFRNFRSRASEQLGSEESDADVRESLERERLAERRQRRKIWLKRLRVARARHDTSSRGNQQSGGPQSPTSQGSQSDDEFQLSCYENCLMLERKARRRVLVAMALIEMIGSCFVIGYSAAGAAHAWVSPFLYYTAVAVGCLQFALAIFGMYSASTQKIWALTTWLVFSGVLCLMLLTLCIVALSPEVIDLHNVVEIRWSKLPGEEKALTWHNDIKELYRFAHKIMRSMGYAIAAACVSLTLLSLVVFALRSVIADEVYYEEETSRSLQQTEERKRARQMQALLATHPNREAVATLQQQVEASQLPALLAASVAESTSERDSSTPSTVHIPRNQTRSSSPSSASTALSRSQGSSAGKPKKGSEKSSRTPRGSSYAAG